MENKFLSMSGLQEYDLRIKELINAANGNITALQNAVNILTGTEEGSVDDKIVKAFANFVDVESADNVVNTYKEILKYIQDHGSEFSDLVNQVDAIQTSIGVPATETSEATGLYKKIDELSGTVSTELVVDVYLKDTELEYTKPYAMDSDNYQQGNYWIFPRVSSEAEIDAWYDLPNKKITCVLHQDVLDTYIGENLGFPELIFTAEHMMAISSEYSSSCFVDYSVSLQTIKLQCLLLVDRGDVEEDKYGFVFSMGPAVPIIMEVTPGETDGEYNTVLTQSADYVKSYIQNGGNQIMVISKNANGIVTGNNLFYGSAAYYNGGEPTILMAVVPNINGKLIIGVVNILGGASYAEVSIGYTKTQVDDLISLATGDLEKRVQELEEIINSITIEEP